MKRIFIVEDDAAIVRSLEEFLKSEGFDTLSAKGERSAVELMRGARADLMLVDVSLSDGNGFAVCEEAKKQGIPVIFLTASDDENSVVRGLDMGADDYIPKPFRPRELVSRINRVLRGYGDAQSVVSVEGVEIDTEKGKVRKNGEEISLSALEYRLLTVFVNNRGRIVSRNKLREDIGDAAGDFVNDNTLTVYIKRLREKIEDDPQDPRVIKTVRGLGYRMD